MTTLFFRWGQGRRVISGRGEALPKSLLFAAVGGEVEGEHALVIRGALKAFRMAQRANGVVIASPPVLLHPGARKVVILRMALVVLGAVDQVPDVVNLMIAARP